jgi:hypothetical protein
MEHPRLTDERAQRLLQSLIIQMAGISMMIVDQPIFINFVQRYSKKVPILVSLMMEMPIAA